MTSNVIESTSEVRIFWSALVVSDLVWIAFFLISFLTFSFKWMVRNLVATMEVYDYIYTS